MVAEQFGELIRLQVQAAKDSCEGGWNPAKGSQAPLEELQDPSFAGAWGPQPIAWCHLMANLRIHAAEEYMFATALLLVTESFPYALFPEVRSALESCARAWWLIDPSDDPRTRVGKWISERSYELRQNRALSQVLQPGDTTIDDSIAQLQNEASNQGFLEGDPPKWVDTPPRPTMTNVIEDMFVGGDGAPFGGLAARYASAITHSTTTALGRLLTFHEDQSAGPVRGNQVFPTPWNEGTV